MGNGIRPICASQQKITVGGRVFLTDKRRRIDLKKPIRDLFEDGGQPISYRMEVCLDVNKILERVGELEKLNVRPVLLYFVRGEEDEVS